MTERYQQLSTGELYYSGLGVGEMWEEIGRKQFDFLVARGLEPSHTLLDIGCGSLRGGVHFIKLLEPEHYCGFDQSPFLITAAREIEIPRYGLAHKRPHLHIRNDFHFAADGRRFDYLLAQSVFTHLTWNSILRCLHHAGAVMHPASRFFATFFECPSGEGSVLQIPQPHGGFTYLDQDPYHYDLPTFVDLARRAGLAVEYIGDWGHPRNQKMLLFTKTRPQAPE